MLQFVIFVIIVAAIAFAAPGILKVLLDFVIIIISKIVAGISKLFHKD